MGIVATAAPTADWGADLFTNSNNDDKEKSSAKISNILAFVTSIHNAMIVPIHYWFSTTRNAHSLIAGWRAANT